MRKFFVVSVFLMILGMTGVAGATAYDFNDMIDNWGIFNLDSIPIVEGVPFSYTHNINDEVDFEAGDLVTSASLELDFTNDLFDTVFTGWLKGLPDQTEYVSYGFDGSGWTFLDEVDNGQYIINLDIALLNIDGKLDVSLAVTNNDNGLGTAYLDHSRLYGTAETAPVPEPATMLLLGSGLFGLAGFRKKFWKK